MSYVLIYEKTLRETKLTESQARAYLLTAYGDDLIDWLMGRLNKGEYLRIKNIKAVLKKDGGPNGQAMP